MHPLEIVLCERYKYYSVVRKSVPLPSQVRLKNKISFLTKEICSFIIIPGKFSLHVVHHNCSKICLLTILILLFLFFFKIDITLQKYKYFYLKISSKEINCGNKNILHYFTDFISKFKKKNHSYKYKTAISNF